MTIDTKDRAMSHQRTIDVLRNLGGAVNGTHAERLVLLAIVEAEEPMQTSAVAALVGMSRGAMTAIVDRLELQGFVRRAHSATDRRVVQLEATTKGRKVVAAAS